MVLGAALALPLAACGRNSNASGGLLNLFGSSQPKLLSRGDRMVRWIYNAGEERMMAPEPMAVMGITNEGRDIPVRLLGESGSDGRYVIALTDIRKVWEFILHRFQNDVFIFHNMDKNFTRLASVRYAKNGRPTFITDQAFADADFQKQLAFWVDRMPGR
ncbi:MAG: hypothetical protein ACM3II_01175 [Rhodospirillaceae bacterium]